MRISLSLALLGALVSPVVAQNETFIAEFVQTLQSLGLTSLATVAGSLNDTGTGQYLLSLLGTGPQTVFAPNNEAFTGAEAVYPNVTGNPELLAQVLSYHILPGTYNSTPTFPNTTVARTLLNSSGPVFLEGGRNQVLVFSNSSEDGNVRILNQDSEVSVVQSTTLENLTIHVTDSVIDIPGSFTAALDFWNLTALTTALQSGGLLDPLNTVHGFTIFAPNDDAFSAAQEQLAGAGSNATLLQTVLFNHVVNGRSVYSGNLIGGGDEVITAAGQGITASFNETGGFVTSGNVTARIVQPDVILWNGVVHIVDTVLFNTESNTDAASSAASAASTAATATTTETGPIGFTPSPTDGSGGGGGGGNDAAGGSTNAADSGLKSTVSLGFGSVAAALGVIAGAFLVL